jgi:hypothetical protein
LGDFPSLLFAESIFPGLEIIVKPGKFSMREIVENLWVESGSFAAPMAEPECDRNGAADSCRASVNIGVCAGGASAERADLSHEEPPKKVMKWLKTC